MDSQSTRVTVVVPCFDQAHSLEESLSSLRAQTLSAWRAVVVDDGSAAPEELENAVAAIGDDRIELVRHDANRGRAAARNTGFGATDTEFVLMLNANDRLPPEALEQLVRALDADGTRDCAFGDVRNFGRQENVIESSLPAEGQPLLDESQVPPVAGTLLRRSFLERIGTFDEAPELAPTREDLEFWFRALNPPCSVEHVAAPLYERRITHMSFYGSPNDDRVADYLVSKHAEAFQKPGLANRFRGIWYARAGRSAYSRGDLKRAYELSMRARRTDKGTMGLKEAARTRLLFSTNRAIDGGEWTRPIPLTGYPMHGKARHRPFFVIGLGHSGNELLRQLLNAHSELHMPPPTWVLGSSYRKFKRHARRMSWPELVQVVLADFAFHPEFRHLKMDLGPVAQRMSYAPKHQRNLAALVNAVYHHHAETHGHGCTRWGDDAPLNSLDDAVAGGDQPKRVGEGVPQTLERLLKVFPDAQFLHLFRDGCDVVSAYLRDGVFDTIDAAATRWLNVELQTTRFVSQHRGSCLDIRFEELVQKPEDVVRGISGFLGVEFEDAMLGASASAGWSWDEEVGEAGDSRRLFSAQQKAQLQSMLGAALAERGYPAAG